MTELSKSFFPLILYIIIMHQETMDLSNNELAVLSFLSGKHEYVEEDQVIPPGMERREASNAISWLEAKNLIDVVRTEEVSYGLSQEGIRYLEEGLPEKRIYDAVEKYSELDLRELERFLPASDVRIGLAQLAKFGLRPSGGKIAFKTIPQFQDEVLRRQSFLESVSSGSYSVLEGGLLEHFKRRGGLLVERKRTRRKMRINASGIAALKESRGGSRIETLTPEIIASGAWRESVFRAFDLSAPAEKFNGGYYHPMSILIKMVKDIFTNMGFTEMPGHYIETAGWNMDALFIPQDHPAREMQDTFYLNSSRDTRMELPEIIDLSRKVHEKGVGRYPGWGYRFDENESRKLLLRTHTTVSTVRYLYEHRNAPQAVFSVEKVFRHESTDWKHLAELHQIEGAYYGKNANLSTLKSLMRRFYSALGFKDIRFIPSYYPYTEPSMDAVAVVNGKEVELGGSGVFRPEVTRPIGLRKPVIAWGMGLERVAMLFFGLSDIRHLYRSDLEWLKGYQIKG